MAQEPYSWNVDRELIAPRQYRSQISGAWKNYARGSDPWATINPSILSDFSCTAFPGNIQLPADSQGWATICVDGAFSMKRHVTEGNGVNSEPEFNMSLAVETQHNVAGHIDTNPNQVLYPGAWDEADLRLGLWRGRGVRVEKVVDIHTMPSGSTEFVEYSFKLKSSTAKVWAGPNYDIRPWAGSVGDQASIEGSSVFLGMGDSVLRGAILKTPVAWYYVDGEIVRTPVKVTFEILGDGETVRATKHIPRALIATALAAGSHLYTDATFSPDADPETSSVDGLTLVSGVRQDWATIIGSAAGFTYSSDITKELRFWAHNTTDDWNVFARAHFGFDCSSIGAGQQVDSASLLLNVDKTYFDDFGFAANIYSSSLASNTDVVTGDHANVGTTPFSTGKTITAMATDWTDETWTYNAAGEAAIDMEGINVFGLALTHDRENGTTGDPTWVSIKKSGFDIRFAENGTNIPVLTVTHSAAGPSLPILAHHYRQLQGVS